MVELTWHELMTEDLRAYEASPGTPQQGNFDEHDLGDYIINRTKLNFFARDFDYNGSQLHGYKMVVPDYYPLRDLNKFFQENKSAFYERLAREITELGPIKVTISFLQGFSMEREGGRVEMEHFFWNRQPIIISNHEQLREEGILERLVDSYKEEIARWQEMGSGWVEEGIKIAYLEVNKYEPIRGGSFIPTPSKLRNKQAIINVKNKDDECLRWACAAHGYCNINYFRTNPKTEVVPVIFHNLKGYDAHHIMSGIAEVQSDLKCIPNNMEKYVSFSLGKLRFIDSLGFLQSSLDALVGTNKPESFTIMASHEEDPTRRKLLLQKGHYPYKYMDAWSRFEETALPPKEAFYSELKREGISDEDYAHAQAVWQAFECKNLGDFHDKYLETDVLLLADVFENFRKTCLNNYKLDPAHYYTSPGLSWDALLKYTGINLELLTDVNKHLFVERGLRGGISMESRRYCKANNRHLSDYNPKEETSYIMYYDANNLYGWAMSQPLPVGKFEWCLVYPTLHQIRRWRANRKIGYILEVDLDYPEELHDEHNAYPLAPEKQVVPKEWMSPYQMALVGGQPEDKTTKLLLTLRNKTRYVLHYRALQQYLDLGMRLRKIHKILKFEQRAWMEPYISLNTELRKRATSDFEKNFFKLMNNSVFGKTMENLRNRIDVKLVRSHERDKLRQLIASPLFARATVFSNNLAGIQMHKSKIIFKRPIYTGMCILDLSKTLMYDFYYKHLKLKYGPRVSLLYTDTDSLLLEIKTEDVYRDMENLRDELYDTSDYPKDHPLHSQLNKKVIGKMKDECSGKPISEVVCLRSKMYSILLEGDKNIKKAKGTTKVVTKKEIKHQNYKEALFGLRTFKHGMNRLRSKGHQIFGEYLTKTTLSPFDSKRWIKEDGIHTLAYGHKDAH